MEEKKKTKSLLSVHARKNRPPKWMVNQTDKERCTYNVIDKKKVSKKSKNKKKAIVTQHASAREGRLVS